jgi:hypothetical protein
MLELSPVEGAVDEQCYWSDNRSCLPTVVYKHHSFLGPLRDWYRADCVRILVWSDPVLLYPMSGPDNY